MRAREPMVSSLVAALAAALMLDSACGGRPNPASLPAGDTHVEASSADAGGVARFPAATREQAREKFESARRSGDAVAVVVYANRLAQFAPTLGSEPQANQDVIDAVDGLDVAQLELAWSAMEPAVEPAGWVALRLALVAQHRGDLGGASAWLQRVAATSAARGRADELAAALAAEGSVDPRTVAVLLPLSGRFERLGRELVPAIELAAAADPDARLVWLDTAGDESGAAAAVDRAVREHRAVAILGPIGQRESLAAAARASQLGIPIALLAPADGGASVDAGVFRLWSSGEWAARAAARAAVERGFDALAVLAPRDPFGAAQSRAFREAAVAAGARIVAAGDYDPTGADLEPDIKSFLGLDPARNPALRRHLRTHGVAAGWKTFSPQVPFDLLFIPDDFERAALVVAYLPYFNVELRTGEYADPEALRKKHGGRVPSLVQLMGSSGWHAQAILPRGGRFIENALVIDACVGGEGEDFPTGGAADFAERYQARVGAPPSRRAGQAFDAARLVLLARAAAAGAHASDPRAAWTSHLSGSRLDDGACGTASVGARGEIERQPLVLRIDGGAFAMD